MNKIILFLVVFITPVIKSHAQQISKSVIGVAGGNFVSDSYSVSYNVGENVVGTMTSDSIQLGNGYFPSLDLSALSVQDISLNENISLFPNPTTNTLNVINEKSFKLEISISDLNGKNLLNYNSNSNLQIDVSGIDNARYIIAIKNLNTNLINSYQFIKN